MRLQGARIQSMRMCKYWNKNLEISRTWLTTPIHTPWNWRLVCTKINSHRLLPHYHHHNNISRYSLDATNSYNMFFSSILCCYLHVNYFKPFKISWIIFTALYFCTHISCLGLIKYIWCNLRGQTFQLCLNVVSEDLFQKVMKSRSSRTMTQRQ